MAAGLTQGQVAAALDVLPTRVSDWENGRRAVTMRYLRGLARVLGVSADAVLEALDAPPEAPQSQAG